jgi:hypothetical protein
MSSRHAVLLLLLHCFCGALIVADECVRVVVLRIFWWLLFFSGDVGDGCSTRFPNMAADEGASSFFFLVYMRGEINDTPGVGRFFRVADAVGSGGLFSRLSASQSAVGPRGVLSSSSIGAPPSVDILSTFMFHLAGWAGQ